MRRLLAIILLTSLTALAQDKLQILYIANGVNRGGKGGAITAYKINSDGKLNLVIGSPFDAGLIPYSLATDDGQHLFLANPALDDNNLRVYPIRRDTGRLEVEHTSTFEGSNYEAERNCCPGPILEDRAGHFVYVGNTGDKTISVYELTPGSLALTQVSKVNTRPGHFPVVLVWGPKQESIFAFTDPGLAVSFLHIYRRDPKSGALTEAEGSPMQIPNLIHIATTDKQLFALTAAPQGSQLHIFDIKPDATISSDDLPMQFRQKPSTFALDNDGKLLALVTTQQSTSNLFLYSADDPPALRRSTKLTCTRPCDITSIAFDSTGRFLYLADTANQTITGLNTSSLEPLPGSPWKSDFQPHSLLVVNPR